MTARVIPMPNYARMQADLKSARATLTQANVCITRLVAALHEIAPGHPLLEELPFCQCVPEPLPPEATE